MSLFALPQVAMWHDVDLATFNNDIAPLGRPAILKGLLKEWPAVQQAISSPQALYQYLLTSTAEQPVTYIHSQDENGRLFYNQDMTGVNFTTGKSNLSSVLDKIFQADQTKNKSAYYIGSASIKQHLPNFINENQSEFFSENSQPNFWISNKVTVATHFDVPDNIACCVSGKRKFTLFPPEQIDNLYVGPIDLTPAGQPISLVDLKQPDFDKFPKFKQALQHAQVAELEPGDALYIPSLWWHNVESLEDINMLVTFFHEKSPHHLGSGFDCLLHGLMAIRNLPDNKKQAWKAFFNHYVFNQTEQASEHIPIDKLGVLGQPSAQISQALKNVVSNNLARH